MSLLRKPCAACGKVVAMRNLASGKARVAHKCEHGKPCVAGSRVANEGWNAGGPLHHKYCAECAALANSQRETRVGAR